MRVIAIFGLLTGLVRVSSFAPISHGDATDAKPPASQPSYPDTMAGFKGYQSAPEAL